MTSRLRDPSPTLRALLAALVDYAGLFPPTGWSMADAVAEFATQRDGPAAWALGRFVVPAARLDELSAAAARHRIDASSPWRVSALLADAAAERDVARVRAFNDAHRGRLIADTLECRVATPGDVERIMRGTRRDVTVFLELPIDQDPAPLLRAIREHGALAKVRTGGVTADAFPSTARLARFIARCAELGVAFKATAGLHHPLRSEQRLTYAADAPCGTMFGFLNVFVAAALASANDRLDELGLTRVLEERDASAFEFGAHALRWRDRAMSLDAVRETRRSFALSFGSCSFQEPIDDLRRLGLL